MKANHEVVRRPPLVQEQSSAPTVLSVQGESHVSLVRNNGIEIVTTEQMLVDRQITYRIDNLDTAAVNKIESGA